jgi:hypothetical protein
MFLTMQQDSNRYFVFAFLKPPPPATLIYAGSGKTLTFLLPIVARP